MPTDRYLRKLKTIGDLSRLILDLKAQGKIIVHCHGVFDLIHPGHIRHFEAAKREGDVLVVTVTRDEHVNKGPGRPVFNQRLRAESIAALECVDYVALNKWPTAVETIKELRPDVYVKGSDYANPENDLTGGISREEQTVRAVGGRIYFTNEITFSSTEILNNHFDVYPEEAQSFLQEFRQCYSAMDIIGQLKNIANLKVLVIGDTIIDEYHYCQAMGKSPKETIVSTRYLREETFAGGILACANHIAGFCHNVDLVTCLGTLDSKEDFILAHLKPNVRTKFFYRDDACTVVKRRFIDPAFLTKMFEVSFLEDKPLPERTEETVCDYVGAILSDYDLVLVGDYEHGFIGERIIRVLCERAKFLAVNTQTNSANIGFNPITKYPRADYVCIDEPEIRLALHDRLASLERLIREVAEKLGSRRVSITRGHLGSVTYAVEEGLFETPVFSGKIVDRVGAGDAYLSVTAPCVAAGCPAEVVGFIGNAVGALAVAIVGNRSAVEPVPLFKFITTLLK